MNLSHLHITLSSPEAVTRFIDAIQLFTEVNGQSLAPRTVDVLRKKGTELGLHIDDVNAILTQLITINTYVEHADAVLGTNATATELARETLDQDSARLPVLLDFPTDILEAIGVAERVQITAWQVSIQLPKLGTVLSKGLGVRIVCSTTLDNGKVLAVEFSDVTSGRLETMYLDNHHINYYRENGNLVKGSKYGLPISRANRKRLLRVLMPPLRHLQTEVERRVQTKQAHLGDVDALKIIGQLVRVR